MSDNINNLVHEARQVKQVIDSEKELKGTVDPLLEAKFKRLERRLASLETKNTGSETIYGSDANMQYRDAFLKYLRKGDDALLAQLATSKVQLNDAGFAVAPSMEILINSEVSKLSVIRKIASVTQVSCDSLDLAIEDSGNKAVWGEPTNNSTVIKRYIKAYDVVAQPKATAKLLEDGEINVEQYISSKIGEAFARAEDESFLIGDGISKPKGILILQNGTNANEIEEIEEQISFAGIMNLQASLDSFYAHNVAYLMHKNTESQIRFLKDTNDNYIWRPAQKEGDNATILGVPVHTTNYMPNGVNSKAIVFGNFKNGYHVVERIGVNLLRDPFTEKPFIKFYTLRRVGGDVTDGRSLKILKQVV